MANNTDSFPLKILWQIILVVALVAGAWTVGQFIPQKGAKSAQPRPIAAAQPSASLVFSLPADKQNSSLNIINSKLLEAKEEIIVVARQITALSLLTNLQKRQAAGVRVVTILSPDTTTNFDRSRLASWMRENNFTGVYKDLAASTSNLILIDRKYVIISDLPLSQRAYEFDSAAKDLTLGYLYVLDAPTLAEEIVKGLKNRVSPSNKLL